MGARKTALIRDFEPVGSAGAEGNFKFCSMHKCSQNKSGRTSEKWWSKDLSSCVTSLTRCNAIETFGVAMFSNSCHQFRSQLSFVPLAKVETHRIKILSSNRT